MESHEYLKPDIAQLPVNHPLPPRLRVGPAVVVFAVFFGVQIVTGAVVGTVAMLMAVYRGLDVNDPQAVAHVTQSAFAPAIVLGSVISGLAVIVVSVLWFRREIQDRSPTGAAWVVGEQKFIFIGLGIGALVACGFLGILPLMHEMPDAKTLGPVAKMAGTPGLQQAVWTFAALLLAPPIEELLFRGVLFGGICRSWGPIWASLLTTGVFVLLHANEMIHFWPAFVFATLMAIAALWIRLRSRAIGSSIALHFAYNAILVGAVLLSTA